MELPIGPLELSGLAEVLAEHDEFWDGRDMRFLHQRVFVHEFGDTCLAARGADGRIAGYLIGFTTPRRMGYIHAVAVRASARAAGCGHGLYQAFEAIAAAQGANLLKAITSVDNAGSIGFHQRLGFEVTRVEDYSVPGVPRIVMTRPLPPG